MVWSGLDGVSEIIEFGWILDPIVGIEIKDEMSCATFLIHRCQTKN